jgi:hypothetical protein
MSCAKGQGRRRATPESSHDEPAHPAKHVGVFQLAIALPGLKLKITEAIAVRAQDLGRKGRIAYYQLRQSVRAHLPDAHAYKLHGQMR